MCVSRPFVSQRTKRSLRPLTNATVVPSGDPAMLDSFSGVLHNADAALASLGTRHKSPSFGTMSARPSLDQNALASEAPAPLNSRGATDRSETYTFETPARSQTNAT